VQDVLEQRRWLLPLGLAVVALVVLANASSAGGFGTRGPALVITLGVAVYAAAALTFLLWFDAPARVTVLLLLVMAAAATATHHADPGGTGGIGLYLGVAFAPLRLALRPAAAVAAVSVLTFDVHLLLAASDRAVFVIVVTGGAAFFFLLGVLLRSEQEQRARASRLVLELEASRQAEKEAAALAERARLSRDMHDVLAHTLSGLVLQLEATALRARRDGSALTDAVERSHRLARDGLREARAALQALRGDTVLGPEGLSGLVEQHQRSTGAPCSIEVDGTARPLATDAAVAVYRTAQEALANARKHAVGAPVHVCLQWTDEQAVLQVVSTGGVPHEDLDSSGLGLGLQGLAERAALAGGRLTATRTGEGFRVELHVPTQRVAVKELS
jgi:signal transduction histidine kinase